MASELQPAIKDIMHGAEHIDVDLLSFVAFSKTRNVSQCGVVRLVSIFSGAGAMTLGPGDGGIACRSNSAIMDAL